MQKTNKAFTLVELIVVITILAILGTIAFISLQGYSKKARDSRRTSDIANIKMSLEMFSLNTGYYPTPDNPEEVLYDNDLLWTQGVVGSNVTTNLGRNLQKKPTDPLHDIEYIYSLASSKKEYEVMSVYEGDLANNSLINSTYASDKYSIKVEGNYNELFVKTSTHIFPVPSLITSATLPLDFDLEPTAIESQVITGGDNFPGLSIPNTETITGGLKINLSVYTGNITKDSEDNDKKAVIEKIQLAYSGSDIETTGVYKSLLAKTTDAELLAFVDDVVLNKKTSSVNKVRDIEAPTGGDFSMDTETYSVDITLTITCPIEDGVEMYLSGSIVGTPEWEDCVSSKDVELSSGDGSKSINIIFKDSTGNETTTISKDITYSQSKFENNLNKKYDYTYSEASNYIWCQEYEGHKCTQPMGIRSTSSTNCGRPKFVTSNESSKISFLNHYCQKFGYSSYKDYSLVTLVRQGSILQNTVNNVTCSRNGVKVVRNSVDGNFDHDANSDNDKYLDWIECQ